MIRVWVGHAVEHQAQRTRMPQLHEEHHVARPEHGVGDATPVVHRPAADDAENCRFGMKAASVAAGLWEEFTYEAPCWGRVEA